MKKNSPKTSTSLSTPTPELSGLSHEEIAQRAYELWVQDGCPLGRSVYHWHEAERQLRQSKLNSARTAESPLSNIDERSLAPLTDDSSPYDGLEKDASLNTKKNARDLAKRL